MPLYEYLCAKCGKRSEIYQNFRDKPIRICPHCGGRVKKLTSAPAIHFKGSGWYVTDYAGKSRLEKEVADAPSSDGGEGKPESKADSKPEGKSEGKTSHKKKKDSSPE
jgi:putative FmdB family regulatory protein